MTYGNHLIRCFLILLFCLSVPGAEPARAAEGEAAERRESLECALDRLEAATAHFVAGSPEAFIALWEHGDEVTLSGGFGGRIEQGWDAIHERLLRVSSLYEDGRFEAERVAVRAGAALGYVAQHERITHRLPDGTEGVRHYRVTMVLKSTDDGWRLIHRQADLHTTPDRLR